MLTLSYLLSFSILICLFGCDFYSSNSSANVAIARQNQPRFVVSGECNVNFDPNTNEIKLLSKMTVDAQSPRARCIIRISTPNGQKGVRLVPLALKGEVKEAPATVAISSILIGDKPTSLSKKYTTTTKFDLTNKIPKTNYTTNGKSVLGINLVLMTNGGELELTDMKFALQGLGTKPLASTTTAGTNRYYDGSGKHHGIVYRKNTEVTLMTDASKIEAEKSLDKNNCVLLG